MEQCINHHNIIHGALSAAVTADQKSELQKEITNKIYPSRPQRKKHCANEDKVGHHAERKLRDCEEVQGIAKEQV